MVWNICSLFAPFLKKIVNERPEDFTVKFYCYKCHIRNCHQLHKNETIIIHLFKTRCFCTVCIYTNLSPEQLMNPFHSKYM